MSNWQVINSEIRACRAGRQPIECLLALFQRAQDGNVALALGEEYEKAGDLGQAIRWFSEAEQLYPMPQFKAKARASLTRVSRMGTAGATSAPTATAPAAETEDSSVLHVVECSWKKIWAEDPAAPTFVPAKSAYRGNEIRAWLDDPRAQEDRWLILSARYGFIEPDHPVANYDVTFSDWRTGPVSNETLRAQVMCQTRWPNRVPLRPFRRVIVHGSPEYLKRTQKAFASSGAVVSSEPLSSGNPSPSQAPKATHPIGPLAWNHDRATALGEAVAQVPVSVFERFDREEPEFPIVDRLARLNDRRIAALIVMCLGITDYQLGSGGAERYWHVVATELAQSMPSTAEEVHGLLGRVCSQPVGQRLADQKLRRVSKVSGAWHSAPAGLEGKSDEAWVWLSGVLQQDRHAKTVVFAMKLLDLLALARDGRYLNFSSTPPIVVDFRIVKISVVAGLIADDGAVSGLLQHAGDIASNFRDVVVEAWDAVARAAGDVSLLRLDSILWQLAGELQGPRALTLAPRKAMAERLTSIGCPELVASRLATELTWVCS